MPLKLTIRPLEQYDEEKNEFFTPEVKTIVLEHSLVSISKWESTWCKPFISELEKDKKTYEETIDYIRCMTLTQNVDPNYYYFIPEKDIERILKYIESPQTATTITDMKQHPARKRVVTSEEIYAKMILTGIPIEFQKWHFNRLLTLIRVIDAKTDTKKMSKSEVLRSNAELNAQRRKLMKSKG